MFITKSKSHEKLETGVGFTGETQKNKAELSQSSRWFIFRISVECMGNCRKVYCCNFTQTHYFNPGFSFSATVGFVQTCCS